MLFVLVCIYFMFCISQASIFVKFYWEEIKLMYLYMNSQFQDYSYIFVELTYFFEEKEWV